MIPDEAVDAAVTESAKKSWAELKVEWRQARRDIRAARSGREGAK